MAIRSSRRWLTRYASWLVCLSAGIVGPASLQAQSDSCSVTVQPGEYEKDTGYQDFYLTYSYSPKQPKRSFTLRVEVEVEFADGQRRFSTMHIVKHALQPGSFTVTSRELTAGAAVSRARPQRISCS